MREVSPGDLVFSFVDTKVSALGAVRSYCYESPKPVEFGVAGEYWDDIGWKVRVDFTRLKNLFRPKDFISLIRDKLPAKYSPLQASGNGNQHVYLTPIPESLAELLIKFIGEEASSLVASRDEAVPLRRLAVETADSESWEQHIEETIRSTPGITETDRRALIVARRGQGLFKQRVLQIERRCRITKVENLAHLRASHCKPWRDCNNDERLDGENGLLLTPSIDHLFDRGFISFESEGTLIISPVADRASLRRMGVIIDEVVNVGSFTDRQRGFLEFHRNSVFLKAAGVHFGNS